MKNETHTKSLNDIVARERSAGCTMADETLVPLAVRRWNSFDRRHKKSKNVTLEHRANDLLKFFLEQYPDHRYDESCLKHLADSFSLALASQLKTEIR